MIPRLKPFLDKHEIRAAISRDPDAVRRFEEAFATTFDSKFALAFPYGRSALWAFFKSHGIEESEIILPAYTCVVVAHAIVLSGNTPKFVDIQLTDYNMDLDLVEEAINERTRAIIATHLFGYPLNVDRLNEIVQTAEARFGHKIWVIQDCAHSFGAEWSGRMVCSEGDFALYGLNISKTITSIFGGMITTNDADLYELLHDFRANHFRDPRLAKNLSRALYLLAIYVAFFETLYGAIYKLEHETPILDGVTKLYHLDNKIHFPPDYLERMNDIEARVGIVQLNKYAEIIRHRRESALFYNDLLQDLSGITLPPIVNGATYSHYVLRVPDRLRVLEGLKLEGIHAGQLIEYSIPHLDAYTEYRGDHKYENSWLCSLQTINLPIYTHLHERNRFKIVKSVRRVIQENTRV